MMDWKADMLPYSMELEEDNGCPSNDISYSRFFKENSKKINKLCPMNLTKH